MDACQWFNGLVMFSTVIKLVVLHDVLEENGELHCIALGRLLMLAVLSMNNSVHVHVPAS